MRRFFLFLLVLFGGISTQAQNAFENMVDNLLSHTVNEITVDSLLKTQQEVILLDAREKKEYNVSHIENAIYVGYSIFEKKNIKNIEKHSPIVVYCSVGYRSEKITEKLMRMGYTNVSNLRGGIFDWTNKGCKVVNNKGATQNIHPFDDNWGKWLTKGHKTYR